MSITIGMKIQNTERVIFHFISRIIYHSQWICGNIFFFVADNVERNMLLISNVIINSKLDFLDIIIVSVSFAIFASIKM